MSMKTNVSRWLVLACWLAPVVVNAGGQGNGNKKSGVQVGPPPYYLVEKMQDSPLKRKLESCSEGPFQKTDFSIGHRGGGTLAVSRTHEGKPRGGSSNGRRHSGV